MTCRVHASFGEDRRDQAGRRRLAVRSGDGDSPLQSHQLGQHSVRGTTGTFAAVRGVMTSVVRSGPPKKPPPRLPSRRFGRGSTTVRHAQRCQNVWSSNSARSEPLTENRGWPGTSGDSCLMPEPPMPTKNVPDLCVSPGQLLAHPSHFRGGLVVPPVRALWRPFPAAALGGVLRQTPLTASGVSPPGGSRVAAPDQRGIPRSASDGRPRREEREPAGSLMPRRRRQPRSAGAADDEIGPP